MSEEEVIKRLEDLIDTCNKGIEMHPYDKELFETDKTALETVLQLLEQKDKRIDELEKALVEEAIKSTKKINKLKDKLIGDKMEQFDDYIIYLIESYLEILEK